jgi:pSer/pThr/pTyr-binding forkhead associated (FHA) protein
VEEFAKEYWVTVLTGSKEGRSFILTRPVISLGRNETTDIPLFGDPGVARLHARLINQGSAVILAAEPGQIVTLNGQPVTQTSLRPGDMIGIAGHRLRFGARRASAPASTPNACPDLTSVVPCPAPASDISRVPTVPPAGLALLEAIAGPHAGAVFSLIPGGLIGRDPRCDVALVNDTQASRQHARLLCDAAGWKIEDAGSTNGTWMNGERITAQPLQAGDQVTIGQTTFMVS